MGFVGRRYAFDFVLRFVLGNVFVRFGNLLRSRNPETIVIGVRLVFRVRPALVNDQAPSGVWMFDHGLLVRSLDDFEGQQIREDRQCFIQRAALVMTFRESDGFQHSVSLENLAL